MSMIEKTITTNGTTRVVRGKRFNTEFRIYSVYGSVADSDELAEMAQELAVELSRMGVERVTLRF